MEVITQFENPENDADDEIFLPVRILHNCPKCSRTFSNIGHMKCHFYKVHPEFKLTDFVELDATLPSKTCKFCNSSFKTKKDLKKHKCAASTNGKPYQCNQCPKSFAHNKSLVHHNRVHRKARDHICHVCQKGFYSPINLVNHLRIHQLGNENSSDDETTAEMPKPQIKLEVIEPDDQPVANTSSFICEMCDKGFRTSTSLKSHLLTHDEETFQCHVCEEYFEDSHDLKVHSRMHKVRQLFVCNVCNASFSTKALLGRHSPIHNTATPLLCEECNAVFSTKQGLNMHLRTHAKTKPYACAICYKRFILKCHLARHLPSHDKE